MKKISLLISLCMTCSFIASKISMPEGMSHGTAISVKQEVVDQLVKWDKNR